MSFFVVCLFDLSHATMTAVHFSTELLSLGVPMVQCVICRPLGARGVNPAHEVTFTCSCSVCAWLGFARLSPLYCIHSVAVSLCVCGTRPNVSAGAPTDAGGGVFTPLCGATNTYLGSVKASYRPTVIVSSLLRPEATTGSSVSVCALPRDTRSV